MSFHEGAVKSVAPLYALRADVHRLHGRYGRYGLMLLVRSLLTNRCFRAIASLRWCQAAAGCSSWFHGPLLLFCKVVHRLHCSLAGMDLPWQTTVGPGLVITRGWGLVASPMARLVSNVTLFHGVTIGRGDRIAQDGQRVIACPEIGDCAWLGPHAIVVGGVRVGDGARLAGGVLVIEDVHAHALMSGNPARLVREHCPPDCMNPWLSPTQQG